MLSLLLNLQVLARRLRLLFHGRFNKCFNASLKCVILFRLWVDILLFCRLLKHCYTYTHRLDPEVDEACHELSFLNINGIIDSPQFGRQIKFSS